MSDEKKALIDALKAWLPEHDKEQNAMFQLGQIVRELWLERVHAKAAEKKPAKADK